MNVSAVSNAVSAAILQQTQAATAAAVTALAAIASGNAPVSSPAQSTGGASVVDVIA